MPRTATRVLGLLAIVVATVIAFVLYRGRPVAEIELVDNARSADELLRRRATEPVAARTEREDGALALEPLSEADVKQLYGYPDGRQCVFDPWMHYRYQPGLAVRQTFPEHPDGEFERRANSLGLRDDHELSPERDFFVLVTGDSQTDGACNNRETFCQRLEDALRTERAGETIEVLDAGICGFSFYNYLGALQRFLPEKPDACIVAFYPGNDFVGMVRMRHFYARTVPPPRTREYWEQISRAGKASSSGVANALNQLLYFRAYPEELEPAFEEAVRVSREIQRVARERSIELLFVCIPVAFPPDDLEASELNAIWKELGLSNDDLEHFQRLTARFEARLRELGIEVLDLREHFGERLSDFYYSDLHVDVRGQELVARVLLPRVRTWLERKR
ncbi:MAG: SGNH/GDSL hydrolase family protein [Planctomycetes bacterium]|nr:SGNH/GDSL hydrolase family protein [Planctomycetota bacterium]